MKDKKPSTCRATTQSNLDLDAALDQYAAALEKRDGRYIEIDNNDQIHFKGIALGLYAQGKS